MQKKICAQPGCVALIDCASSRPRYCPRHTLAKAREESARARDRTNEADRPSARARGYTWRWQKFRAEYLARHPFCAQCARDNPRVPVLARELDHIVPHRGDQALFWAPDNVQGLCKACHNRKTARGR